MVYEQPHQLLWSIDNNFQPNYFVPIDIERKLSAYALMKSQVRAFRSPDTLKSMSQLRGKQSNNNNAEAYQILRWID